MPATEDAPIEKVGAFLQKVPIPCGAITQICIQLFNPAMENLANYLSAQLSFKLLGDLRIRAAAPEDHPHYSVIESSCGSGIGTGKCDLGIVNAPATSGFAFTLSELQRDGDKCSILTTTDYI